MLKLQLKLALLGGLIALLAGIMIFQSVRGGTAYNKSQLVLQEQSLLLAIKQGADLTTATYTYKTALEINNVNSLFNLPVGLAKLKLLVTGKVRAGFDLAALTQDSIELTPESISLTLPPLQIQGVEIEKTEVLQESATPFTASTAGMREQLHALAKEQFRLEACAGGIIKEAQESATKVLTPILQISTSGKKVNLNFQNARCLPTSNPAT